MSDQRPDQAGVGYRKPPKAGQFKKGASGNPKGRPKGSMRDTAVKKILSKFVTISIDGRDRRVRIDEALALKLAQAGLKGNDKIALDLLRLSASEKTEPTEAGEARPYSVADEEWYRKGGFAWSVDLMSIVFALLDVNFFIIDENWRIKISKKIMDSVWAPPTIGPETIRMHCFKAFYLEGAKIPFQEEEAEDCRRYFESHWAVQKSEDEPYKAPDIFAEFSGSKVQVQNLTDGRPENSAG